MFCNININFWFLYKLEQFLLFPNYRKQKEKHRENTVEGGKSGKWAKSGRYINLLLIPAFRGGQQKVKTTKVEVWANSSSRKSLSQLFYKVYNPIAYDSCNIKVFYYKDEPD